MTIIGTVPHIESGNTQQMRRRQSQLTDQVNTLTTAQAQSQKSPSQNLTVSQSNITSSRVFGTRYLASSPLMVTVSGELTLGVGHTATIQAQSGGINVAYSTISNGSGFCSVTFMVASGATYKVNTGGIGPGDTDPCTLTSWIEWSLGIG